MKTKLTIVVVFLSTVLSLNAAEAPTEVQDKEKVTIVGTFDGYDIDDGYAFLVKSDNKEGEGEQTLYLQTASEEALKMVNLKSKDMEGKSFEVICEVTQYEEKDENGEVETFESYHIISVKKL